MYSITGGGLAFTGVALGWQIVAAATVLTVGGALLRLAPRIRRRRSRV